MHRIILHKPVANVQIGHLYEHIFCAQLTQALVAEGVFEYLDYALDAKTLYAGYVRLEVSIYTAAGSKVISLLRGFSININDDAIDGALLQIMAEKYADVRTFDRDVVVRRLHDLQELPWIDISTIKSDFDRQKVTTRHMNFTDRAPRHFAILTQTISVPEDALGQESELLPLFYVLAKAIRTNLQNEIAANSFCYSTDDEFRVGKLVQDKNAYRIDKRQATKLTDEMAVTGTLLEAMVRHDFIGRLSDSLMNLPADDVELWPSDVELQENTGHLVGLEYWKQYATVANIRALLRRTTISYKLGSTTDKIDLAVHRISK